jgi:protein-tyrosine phosphatase
MSGHWVRNPVDDGIQVCGLVALENKLRDFKPDLVVSCVPPGVELGDVPMLKAGCKDIYLNQLSAYKDAVRSVLLIEEPRVLIHCQHGLSRSAALACALLWKRDPASVNRFLEDNPEVQPNPLLLLIADEELGADFDLMRRCRHRWKGKTL